MRFEILLLLICIMEIVDSQMIRPGRAIGGANFKNNLAEFPGHTLDIGWRVRSRNNNNGFLNSDSVAAELAQRQRDLYAARNGRRFSGQGAENFRNNEAKFPGSGFDTTNK